MPYDPRMLQMAQMGVGMMGPQQRNAFADPRSQQPKPWWEQAVQYGQPANRPAYTPDDRTDDQRKQPSPPSLLQMLMLGGPATYSGTPRPGATSPWGMLGNMGLPGWGGGGGAR